MWSARKIEAPTKPAAVVMLAAWVDGPMLILP